VPLWNIYCTEGNLVPVFRRYDSGTHLRSAAHIAHSVFTQNGCRCGRPGWPHLSQVMADSRSAASVIAVNRSHSSVRRSVLGSQ